MLPADEQIESITREVLSSFGYETALSSEVARPKGLASKVEIAGPASATVEVELPWDVASRLAAALFETTESPTPEDMVRDLTAELANMIGGNIKGLLPGPSSLSIPVVRSITPAPPEPQGPNQTSVGFDCELGRFVVKVTMHAPHGEISQ
jgi:chemotaxis protein CheX